jgi:predicted phosphoadenosine phosphosulfate sulfurtransferase
MARFRKYIDSSVIEEASNRIAHIYDVFDTVVYMFSGGKDSLVCIHLGWEEAKKRYGEDAVIDVVFRDEELIHPSVIDFVNEYRNKPWIRMRWFCAPLENETYILTERSTYWAWDPDREWARPMPDWAEKLEGFDGKKVDQHSLDAYIAKSYRGMVAFVTGIRAEESNIRYRSVVNKLHDNYITAPTVPSGVPQPKRVRMAKPIYDWTENDIMKWLHESKIPWCQIYDAQAITGVKLRVSTPLHFSSVAKLPKLAQTDPELWEMVLKVFPEAVLQKRYGKDFDTEGMIAPYRERGWEGVAAFIAKRFSDDKESRIQAKKRLAEFKTLSDKDPESFTPDYLLSVLAHGRVDTTILNNQTVRMKRRAALLAERENG